MPLKPKTYEEALAKKKEQDAKKYAKGIKKRTVKRETPVKRKSKPKTKLAKKRELLNLIREQYNLPTITCSRWGTAKAPTRTDLLKGMLWTVFAPWIRNRDKGKPCIACGRIAPPEETHAGHYAPVAGNDIELCFMEENVNGECEDCNTFDDFHLVPMRKNLVVKWGEKKINEIDRIAGMKRAVKWREDEFVEKILYYHKGVDKP